MKHTFKRNIAIVCLLVAGITSLSGCGIRSESGAGELEDSPYPCKWELKGKACTISVEGDLPDNAQWTVYDISASVDVEQLDEPGRFKVSAQESGSGSVTLSMRESGLPVEVGVDFSFGFSVDDKNKITLDSAVCTEKTADVFTTETGKTACWQESTVGGQFIYLTGADWTVVSTQGVVVYGPTADGDNVRLEVMAGENAARRSLVLQSGDGEGIDFTFAYNASALTVAQTAAKSAEEMEELLLSLSEEEAPAEQIDYGPAHEQSRAAADDAKLEELQDAIMEETIKYWDEQLAELRKANNDQNGQ